MDEIPRSGAEDGTHGRLQSSSMADHGQQQSAAKYLNASDQQQSLQPPPLPPPQQQQQQKQREQDQKKEQQQEQQQPQQRQTNNSHSPPVAINSNSSNSDHSGIINRGDNANTNKGNMDSNSAHIGGSGINVMAQTGRDAISSGLQSSPKDTRSTVLPQRSPSITSMSPPVSVLSQQERYSERPSSAEPRSLPSYDITDASIDDAFVAFILYCNPSIPSSTNTAELRRMFRSPPRSEGKNFSTFALWELIQKLNSRELKTWSQLAIELGVDPPSIEKKQSTQKVQQYAVRLKRWMHAMHIDAFFEFLLGHSHPYYTKVHSLTEQEEECRDGVPREEDLALRALMPEWKPKRGRKRVDEPGIEPKQPKKFRLFTPNSAVEGGHPSDEIPQSSIPWSAYPSSAENHHSSWPPPQTAHQGDPAPPRSRMVTPERPVNGQGNARWSFPVHRSPPFQYPQSAVTPRHRGIDVLYPNEPQSAISSLERANGKRRGRLAVSSAWLGNSNLASGKPRGRPLQPPSVDGPPSFLSTTMTTETSPNTHSNGPLPPISTSNPEQDRHEETAVTTSAAQTPQNHVPARPTKLHLQVPKSVGTPIRLATPPLLLVNGQNGSTVNAEPAPKPTGETPSDAQEASASFSPTLKQVDEALTHEIQSATLFGRTTPLSAAESRAIAHSTITQVMSQCHPNTPSSVMLSYCAFSLGLGHKLGLACKAPEQMKIKFEPSTPDDRIRVHLPPDDPNCQTPDLPFSINFTLSYDFSPTPGAKSQVSIRGSAPSQMTLDEHSTAQHSHYRQEEPRTAAAGGEDHIPDDDESLELDMAPGQWKQRYMLLRQQTRKKDAALLKYKKQILEAVMTDP